MINFTSGKRLFGTVYQLFIIGNVGFNSAGIAGWLKRMPVIINTYMDAQQYRWFKLQAIGIPAVGQL
jgi:hypothetical protein